MTNDQFRNKLLIVPDCPKQDLDDGTGKELWKSVEDFADDQELWIEEFVEVFEKMQCNGYESLEQGPKEFWSHFQHSLQIFEHLCVIQNVCNKQVFELLCGGKDKTFSKQLQLPTQKRLFDLSMIHLLNYNKESLKTSSI